MKSKERLLARELRKQGMSLRAISKEIKCSKGSVSQWIRDIQLTTQQIRSLKDVQDKGRAKAANHPNSPKLKWERIRSELIQEAKGEISLNYSSEILKLICVALYWAEGYKQSRALFIFANTDPDMVRLMIRFLLEICKIKKDKFRGGVNIHSECDIDKAQKYWSKISQISLKQFHKPTVSISRASLGKRKNLPYGTFRIIISDVILCSRMHGWIDGLKQISFAGK